MKTSIDELRLRLLDQCFKHNKTHLGSYFSTLPILKEIFDRKKPTDKLVLSNGHAAAALFVCIEAYLGKESDLLFESMGDHPKRSPEFGIDCSTGSLGMGITVAVGMAISNPKNIVFCVVSDGECAEGSFWESIRYISHNHVTNFQLYVNINNYSAYDELDGNRLGEEILSLYPTANLRFSSLYPFEKFGLSAHYIRLSEETYLETKRRLCDSSL